MTAAGGPDPGPDGSDPSPPAAGTVLVVDDDRSLQKALALGLRARGYRVVVAGSGSEGLAAVERFGPGVVLLDLGLPDMDGVEVVRAIRTRSAVAVVVLSARHQAAAKTAALEAGADDYLTKPFGMDDLLARVGAALDHTGPPGSAVTVTGSFTVDLAERRVDRDGATVHLTPKEWELVEALVRNPGRLLPQRRLLDAVWGPGHEDDAEYLRVLMGRVRRKLEEEPARPRHFRTEPGLGYRFEP